MDACLSKLSKRRVFKKEELFEVAKDSGKATGVSAMEKYLSRLLKNGEIARVGRNAYCLKGELRVYRFQYTDISEHIADILLREFYDLDFRIMEMYQLNGFVNHQIAHNIIFVYVEKEVSTAVFERLKKDYAGKILINPTEEIFYNYRSDDMVVVRNLVSESPKGFDVKWHTGLEKLLVDVFAERLVRSMLAESEYKQIFETAFQNYVIDESGMFRYANRRKNTIAIKKFLTEETAVELRVG